MDSNHRRKDNDYHRKLSREMCFVREIENFHALHANHNSYDYTDKLKEISQFHSNHNPATVVEEKILDLMKNMKEEYLNVISIERDNATQIMKLVHEEDSTVPVDIAISERNLHDEMAEEQHLKECYITDYMSSYAASMTPVELNMYNMFSEFRMELEMTLCMERAKHKQAVEILTETHTTNMKSLGNGSGKEARSRGGSEKFLCPSVIAQPSVSYKKLAKPIAHMTAEEAFEAELDAAARTQAFLSEVSYDDDYKDSRENKVDKIDDALAATTNYILQHPNTLVVSDDSPGQAFFNQLNTFIESSLDVPNKSSKSGKLCSSSDDSDVKLSSSNNSPNLPTRCASAFVPNALDKGPRRVQGAEFKNCDEDEMLARAMAMMHAGWM